MIKFSLLVPTRNRVIAVERLLNSLIETTEILSHIEVLFMYDEDDIITKAYLENCLSRFPIQIRRFEREQSDFLNRDYYNRLAGIAEGEFRWVCGDDLIFTKKNWDTYLLNTIDMFLLTRKDRVLYVALKDNTPKPPDTPNYGNFPIISENAIKAVGYFMPPTIPSWSSDFLIYLLYSHPQVNRVLQINEAIFEHVSVHTTQVVEDESSQKQRRVYSKYHIFELAKQWELVEAPNKIHQLINYIYLNNKGNL